jgi:DNA polymerase-3 subunit epsilon
MKDLFPNEASLELGLPAFDRPLIILDAEADSYGNEPDPFMDRSVSWAFKKVHPNNETEVLDFICCPEDVRALNPRSTEIHGITWDMVKDEPCFRHFAPRVLEFITGCHFIGYNHVGYDIPLLHTEFRRCRIDWNPLTIPGTLIIDPSVIAKKKEKRDLTWALQFYAGEKHDGAHGAMADVDATLKVLLGQIRMYPDLAGMDMATLAEFSQMNRRLDLAGKIVLDDEGFEVFTDKKVRGVRLKDDLQSNRPYAHWMVNQDWLPANTREVLERIIEKYSNQNDDELFGGKFGDPSQ